MQDLDAKLGGIDKTYGNKYQESFGSVKLRDGMSCCNSCVQKSLFIGNILAMSIGFGLVIVGAYLISSSVSVLLGSLAMGVIVFGGFILSVSCFGCCGARFKFRLMLLIYILIVFIVALSLTIVGAYLISIGQPEALLELTWPTLSNDVRVGLQQAYGCCGLMSMDDAPGIPCPSNGNLTDNAIFPCVGPLLGVYEEWYMICGYLGLGFGGLMFLACIMASCFTRSIGRRKKILKL